MSTLHGSWICQSVNSYFFIWAETWRTLTPADDPNLSEPIPLHPFTIKREESIAFFDSHDIPLTKVFHLENNIEEIIDKRWQTEIITLPSQKKPRKKVFLPILSAQFSEDTDNLSSLSLQTWQVEGFYLTPIEAVNFLQLLPLGSLEDSDDYLGDDLRFWTHIYRWSLDLLTRRKFLPGIIIEEEKKVRSCWQPLLDSIVDRTRLAKFTRLMPDACRAYEIKRNFLELLEPQELLLRGLTCIIDARLRTWVDSNIISAKNTTIQPWLESLAQESAVFDLDSKNIKRLETALYNWTLPVQNYLIKYGENKLKHSLFCVCLVLKPPTKNDSNSIQEDWQLQYYLQALDDQDFLVAATEIWQNNGEYLFYKNRPIEQPQEILLKGLGLASRLYSPIAESLQEAQPIGCFLNPIQVYEFIRSNAWQLQDNGLGVILPPGLAYGEGEKRLGIKIQAEVNPKKGEHLSLKSLLNYQINLAVGDRTISQQEFENLLAAKSPLVEVNGEWIALQPADVRAAQGILNRSIEEINLSVEDALRLSTGDTKVIAKLPVVGFETSGILQELIDNLTNNQAIKPIETPKSFKGELRPYQARGVGWLAFLERWSLGACLADDMGLGKTPQLIAFLLTLKEQDFLAKPTLVICPTSVIGNWEREVKKFAPTLSTLIHHGDKRAKGKDFLNNLKNKNLVITSYPLAYRDTKTLEQIDWQGVVLDEAQNIKNPQAKQSQAVRTFKAGFRIALTGTPVENRLSELWSIIDFLNPGFLGTRQFFQRRFAMPIEKFGDRESLQTLRSLVQPFILRRLKTDKTIIQDLPEKQEMNVYCGLSAEQAQLYQQLVDESLVKIEESEGIKRKGLILTLILRLKQLCNHPVLLPNKSTSDRDNFSQRSGKLLRLEEMLEELISEGDRALIFTQFAEWGKLLQPYLAQKLGEKILFLYGSTGRQEREEIVDRFQNDPQGPPILILSLKAGGTGLNLTRANHIFHVDRWWNPAVENQATDRAFRIGQKQNVQVHKFVCTGTLEEKISDTIEQKKQLAEQTVDAGEDWLTELDNDRLRSLLLLDRNAIIDEEN
jgi:SNF2 family DNA or RNA helicase